MLEDITANGRYLIKFDFLVLMLRLDEAYSLILFLKT